MIKRLKDIATYIQLTSFPCKACGCVNTLDEVIVRPCKNNLLVTVYKAFCAHCDSYIMLMPTAKIKRLWWKGEMQEIAKLDTGLLMWMLKQSYGSKNNSRYIRAVLKSRLDEVEEVPDLPFIEVEAPEATKVAAITPLQAAIDHLKANHLTMDAVDIRRAEETIKRLRKL